MEDNDKIIYLKDVIKGKTPSEILAMFPIIVCVERTHVYKKNGKEVVDVSYASYEALGVTPKSLLLATTICCEDNDDFSWSPYYYEDGYREIPLDKLDELDSTSSSKEVSSTTKYIYCSECTSKQRDFLIKYCDYDENDCISGYEAFHVIQNTIESWKKHKEQREKYSRTCWDYDWEDEWSWHEHDVPNM